jgi:cytochrome P450
MSGAFDPDLLNEEALRDPYPILAGMREDAPVRWSERYGSWMIMGYDACAAAHTDQRISSDRIQPALTRLEADPDADPRLVETLRILAGWMVFKDGHEHRRLRGLVQGAFTPRTVAQMQDRVTDIADELLRELSGDEVDLVAGLAAPLPASVIAEMLGAPRTDHDRFRGWSEDLVSLVFGGHGDEGRHGRAIVGMTQLVAYLDELVAAKRDDPQEDLVSLTLRHDSSGQSLTEHEVVAMCTLFLFGGSETTTNLIGSGLLALMRHPEQLALLRERPELAGQVVEEILRYDGPARMSVRIVGSELELGDENLRAGQRVLLVLAAANRDPRQFVRPDEFDILREPNSHLGFGLGRHYCLGASLARLEGRIVIPRALEVLGDMELAEDDLHYHPHLISRGLHRLPVFLPRRSATHGAAG